MTKAGRIFVAHIGEPIERLIGTGETQTVVRSCEVLVKTNGAVIETIQAADDDTDIREKLAKRGFIPGERTGNQIALTRQKVGAKNFALAIVALVIIVGMIILWLVNIFSDDGKPSVGSGDAVIACQSLVKDELKSPGSAKFSGATATGSGSSWTSQGEVDSQNGFGAMIRTSYSCVLSYDDSSDSWSGRVSLK